MNNQCNKIVVVLVCCAATVLLCATAERDQPAAKKQANAAAHPASCAQPATDEAKPAASAPKAGGKEEQKVLLRKLVALIQQQQQKPPPKGVQVKPDEEESRSSEASEPLLQSTCCAKKNDDNEVEANSGDATEATDLENLIADLGVSSRRAMDLSGSSARSNKPAAGQKSAQDKLQTTQEPKSGGIDTDTLTKFPFVDVATSIADVTTRSSQPNPLRQLELLLRQVSQHSNGNYKPPASLFSQFGQYASPANPPVEPYRQQVFDPKSLLDLLQLLTGLQNYKKQQESWQHLLSGLTGKSHEGFLSNLNAYDK